MWFKLDKEKFTETFCASTKNEKEQKELLSNFFNEVVLRVVKDYLSHAPPTAKKR